MAELLAMLSNEMAACTTFLSKGTQHHRPEVTLDMLQLESRLKQVSR